MKRMRYAAGLTVVLLVLCAVGFYRADAETPRKPERKLKVCFTRSTEAGTIHKGVVSRKVWSNGSTIRIVFLDGGDAIKTRVAEIAKEWTRYANLTFDFSDGTLPPAQADVRVSFAYQGYWSFMGPDVTHHRNPANPTVNLEGLADEPDEEVQRVTLHEFGHVLGLYHEHQNPSAHIQWNRDAVYQYFEQKQGWPRALVDQEYLKPQPLNNVVYSTPFDPQSIMCYRILPEFTADGLLIDYNRALSDMDKEVIARLYPR